MSAGRLRYWENIENIGRLEFLDGYFGLDWKSEDEQTECPNVGLLFWALGLPDLGPGPRLLPTV